jgi:hypothetical protein
MRLKRILLEFARAEKADDPYAFDFRAEEYLLRTEGGGFRRSTLRWSEALLDDLHTLRTPGCDPAIVQRVGERLRRFLQPADFARHEQEIVRAVSEGEAVHVTIRSAAAELYALPWELLTVGPGGQHLGELPGVLLRYTWPETRTTPAPRPGREEGRILFAWSDAGGWVPSSEHLDALQRTCREHHHPFDDQADVIPQVTLARLEEALAAATRADRPVSVLHILCHGAAQGQTYGLSWSDDGGRAAIVDAGRLRQALAPHAGQLRMVVLCACDSGNIGELGNQLGSVAQNLHTAGIQAVVASRFPLSVRGSQRLTEALYGALLGGPSSMEQAFLVARRALAGEAASLDWASLQLYARPDDGDDTRPLTIRPYRGLLPFHQQHARFFFGRDAESGEVLGDLRALVEAGKPRFVVIAGASGTGKSSIVMAGVIPKLVGQAGDEAGGELDVQRMLRTLERWQAHAQADDIKQGIELLRRGLSRVEQLAGAGWEVAVMRIGSAPMAALESALATRRDPARAFLLVIDQFEELFSAIPDAQARQTFARKLWSLCRENTNVHCMVTLRVDFLGACGEIVLDEGGLRLDQVAYDEAHRIFAAQMGPDQLRAAIEEPARLVGLELEPGLAATMLEDIGGEPGALPLVQYTLDLLWQRRTGGVLTTLAYRELGGVTGALQRHADALIDAFSAEEQRQARRLLVRLVAMESHGAMDTRRQARVDQLRPARVPEQAAFDRVLAVLVQARLLVRSDERGVPVVEVAHEALIRKWPRLQGWLVEDRDKLAELHELEKWREQFRQYGTLIEGKQLGYAQSVREKYPSDLDPDIVELIDASVRKIQKRQRRTRAVLVGVFATLIAITGVFSVLYLGREAALARAEDEEERALSQKALAEEAQKVAQHEKERAEAALAAVQREKERAESEKERAESEKERAEQAALAEKKAHDATTQARLAAERAKVTAEQQRAQAVQARLQADEQRARAVDERTQAEIARARAVEAEARTRAQKENLEAAVGGGIIRELPLPSGKQRPASPEQ